MIHVEVCALCGNAVREVVLRVTVPSPSSPRSSDSPQPFTLLRCAFCGLVMTSPRLEKAELEAYYAPEYWGRTHADDPAWVRRDQAPRTAFLGRFSHQGRVLDVGCGLGLFLLALDPARWERYGLEVMPAAYREAARRLGPDRITATELTAAVLPQGHFDVVTFWDALEHLPDPKAALSRASRLLRPGGLVLLRLPNFESYLARHFGEDWYELSLPYHLYHVTPATLTRLLEATGFRVRVLESSLGSQNYHAFKHSVLHRLERLHGPSGGRLRYYLLKPALRPWEWISTRRDGGSSMQICAERLPVEAS